jgi:hypothetical protein
VRQKTAPRGEIGRFFGAFDVKILAPEDIDEVCVSIDEVPAGHLGRVEHI